MKQRRPVPVLGMLILLSFIGVPLFISCSAEEGSGVPHDTQGEMQIQSDMQKGAETQADGTNIAEPEYIRGKVIEILEEEERESQGGTYMYQKLLIEVTRGSLKGEEITVEHGGPLMAQVVTYGGGDRVMISHTEDLEGNDVFFITDYVRTPGLLYLFLFFAGFSVIIGGRKGVLSIAAMAFSFFVLFVFVLPQIQDGGNPVMIVILASFFIVPVTFYLSHGFEKKTTVSIAGTFIALIITGVLSAIFVSATHLSGLSSEDALLLQVAGNGDYNLKGLLLAGIIIGTLGVLDDITVSQTAIVYQLNDLKPDVSFNELFMRAIHIGKDHIASMINTLVLVYTGASLPLLLIFLNNPRPVGDILNLEMISTEVVRTLVGSIGLVLAVPITTYLACYFAKKKTALV
jgi:uncharacterized membrane protein